MYFNLNKFASPKDGHYEAVKRQMLKMAKEEPNTLLARSRYIVAAIRPPVLETLCSRSNEIMFSYSNEEIVNVERRLRHLHISALISCRASTSSDGTHALECICLRSSSTSMMPLTVKPVSCSLFTNSSAEIFNSLALAAFFFYQKIIYNNKK